MKNTCGIKQTRLEPEVISDCGGVGKLVTSQEKIEKLKQYHGIQ
jgi:hypothetical protein